jgi:hypothetical protein
MLKLSYINNEQERICTGATRIMVGCDELERDIVIRHVDDGLGVLVEGDSPYDLSIAAKGVTVTSGDALIAASHTDTVASIKTRDGLMREIEMFLDEHVEGMTDDEVWVIAERIKALHKSLRDDESSSPVV